MKIRTGLDEKSSSFSEAHYEQLQDESEGTLMDAWLKAAKHRFPDLSPARRTKIALAMYDAYALGWKYGRENLRKSEDA